MSKLPQFSSDIPYVPVNWNDRDSIVGRLMEIIEASMPEGKQQAAVKNLIKQRVSEYFTHLFNDAFISLKGDQVTIGKGPWDIAVEALWEARDVTKDGLAGSNN